MPGSVQSLQRFFNTGENPIEHHAETRASSIHGLGVFARRDIPRGTTWWHARQQDVLLITRAQHEALRSSVQSDAITTFRDTIVFYAYYLVEEDVLVLCLDNARYVNHSDVPNSGLGEDKNPFRSVALRDIHAGEEIVENYRGYARCPWATMYRAFLEQG
ncbi:MAG: SET domain-containing protein [Candidatus Lokiarchaeota archaeon]|nr:SET domain-containing protein [Candidatus Lokiarchaeota archaeon]